LIQHRLLLFLIEVFSENVVLAQEIVHSFKNMKRKRGYVGVKIDFNKAYDKRE
jgi:hypothetical protein